MKIRRTIFSPTSLVFDIEVIMDDTATTFPSLTWRRSHEAQPSNVEAIELSRTPTWPANLPGPESSIGNQPQPDLYLQLSQILEWEIWKHNHTRCDLSNERGRCRELEARVHQISTELVHWQKACQTVYTALDEHRAAYAKLQLDNEAITAELRRQRSKRDRKVISLTISLSARSPLTDLAKAVASSMRGRATDSLSRECKGRI
jgi:hypothetical protein